MFLKYFKKSRRSVDIKIPKLLQNSAKSGEPKCLSGNEFVTPDSQVPSAYHVMLYTKKRKKNYFPHTKSHQFIALGICLYIVCINY